MLRITMSNGVEYLVSNPVWSENGITGDFQYLNVSGETSNVICGGLFSHKAAAKKLWPNREENKQWYIAKLEQL